MRLGIEMQPAGTRHDPSYAVTAVHVFITALRMGSQFVGVALKVKRGGGGCSSGGGGSGGGAVVDVR